MPTRVLIADDHTLVRQGLRTLLEQQGFEVAGEASDGQEALRLMPTVLPDAAILDIGMQGLSGLDAAREIHRSFPGTKTILLTRHGEAPYVVEALRLGVKGYVLKTQVATDLRQAIEQACRGAVYLSPGISRPVMDGYRPGSEVAAYPLTSRERQVLQLVGEGNSTKDVARLLGISVKTAESHRTRLMRKLDIHETASLVRYAVRQGLIQP